MNFYINPACQLNGAFTVPSIVVDRYFKLAKAEHIKILLYVLRYMADIPDEGLIASGCGVSEYEVKEALLYWADAGILNSKEAPAELPKKETKPAVKRNEKPSRSDILKRSLEDPKIQYLLLEAQKRFGRNLKDNESRTLVWLYDDQGLELSVILLIIQHAVLKGKQNIGFIENVAMSLINKGINDVASADEELHKLDLGEKAWEAVCKVFGIDKRKPSQKELDTSRIWLEEWQVSKEMLTLAYDECVNKKSKFSFAYVSKIIENWHKNGMKPTENKPKKGDNDFVTYDIDLFEKMINSKD